MTVVPLSILEPYARRRHPVSGAQDEAIGGGVEALVGGKSRGHSVGGGLGMATTAPCTPRAAANASGGARRETRRACDPCVAGRGPATWSSAWYCGARLGQRRYGSSVLGLSGFFSN
jgi:hypothetical protein